ncbi:MAG: hypothetical protein J0G30_10925 [Actinomycetales bacterium]|nr:hypothetical protein [Actinomycetales bacterium]
MPSPSPAPAADLAEVAARGRALILSLQDPSGAYPASPTFSAYLGFSWLRDGAFIADAMSAGGEEASATAFFDWCARTLELQAERIERIVRAAREGRPVPDGEMLATRFRFDGTQVDDGWENFQLDGYGLWLWAALAHARRHGLDPDRWHSGIALTADYLVSSWARPCYDWWEEHVEHVHISTLGSIEAGLRAIEPLESMGAERRAAVRAAADAVATTIRERGVVDGHLVKWIGSTEVDASLAALIAPLAVVDAGSDLARATLAELERRVVVDGGTHRFPADTYYGGGQWPLLSCFLGLAHLRAGDADRARELLAWAAGTERPAGTLPEQVEDHLLEPSALPGWVERWGTSADPLLWSSAMFLRLAAELGEVGA